MTTTTPSGPPANQAPSIRTPHAPGTARDGVQTDAPRRSIRASTTRSTVVAALAVSVLALAGCGTTAGYGTAGSSTRPPSATQSPSGQAAASGAVQIKDFGYSGDLTVTPGQKITVTNGDAAAHTLTSTSAGLFDTGRINASGGTGTFTAPTTPGTYPFGCTFHPDMAGTLIVK